MPSPGRPSIPRLTIGCSAMDGLAHGLHQHTHLDYCFDRSLPRRMLFFYSTPRRVGTKETYLRYLRSCVLNTLRYCRLMPNHKRQSVFGTNLHRLTPHNSIRYSAFDTAHWTPLASITPFVDYLDQQSPIHYFPS